MDAVIYIKAWKRMCKTFSACDKCLLHVKEGCMAEIPEEAERAVSIVEQWAKVHPIRTRQSEFLRMFPDVIRDDTGLVSICPKKVCTTYQNAKYCVEKKCGICRQEFWLEEVTDND